MNKKLNILILIFLLIGCSNSGDYKTRPAPINLDKSYTCAICGMTVIDQTGPKAQILYDKDKTAAFCSTSDMFIWYLQPDRPINIRAIYVEEIDNNEKPSGKWIDGESAYYVYGKDIAGYMGNTFIPFKDASKAKDFASKHNGLIARIDKVNLGMIGLKD
ncbi:MAG: nitrous oxide reductase accessory protein NosL [Nitrospirae bacterium]|nr:nitrous oxide reductase accessory protein NosL [Nitrospirota bacterium]